MFSLLHPFEQMPFTTFVNDPWSGACSPLSGGGCTYQARPNYSYAPVRRPVATVVRRPAPKPRPQVIDPSDRIRIVREARGATLFIELPGFSKEDIT